MHIKKGFTALLVIVFLLFGCGGKSDFQILDEAVKIGDLAVVKSIMENESFRNDPKIRKMEKDNERTVDEVVLAGAIIDKQEGILNYILEKGKFNPEEIKGHYGDTFLQCAAETGFLPGVKALVELGADVNHADEEGKTPFVWAFSSDISQYLVSKGADPNVYYQMKEINSAEVKDVVTWAIEEASFNNLFSPQKWGGPNINLELRSKKYKASALDALLSYSDCVDTVQRLLESGAKVNPKMEEGTYTPLMYALQLCYLRSEEKQDALMELFFKYKVDVNQATTQGLTALYHLIDMADYQANYSDTQRIFLKMARLLIKKGAKVNVSVDGMPMLARAYEHCSDEMIALLLKAGASLDAKVTLKNRSYDFVNARAIGHGSLMGSSDEVTSNYSTATSGSGARYADDELGKTMSVREFAAKYCTTKDEKKHE